MKHCLITLAALLAAASTFAQGTVNFANKATGLSAQVYYGAVGTAAVGGGTTDETKFVAQLWQVAANKPVGDAIPFRSDAGKGFWVGATRTLDGVAAGANADLKVVAWSLGLGADYLSAKAANRGGVGESAVLNIKTGGDGTPPALPATLTGLTSFTISTITSVPEPSIAALGLLGAGLLLVRRKK